MISNKIDQKIIFFQHRIIKDFLFSSYDQKNNLEKDLFFDVAFEKSNFDIQTNKIFFRYKLKTILLIELFVY